MIDDYIVASEGGGSKDKKRNYLFEYYSQFLECHFFPLNEI